MQLLFKGNACQAKIGTGRGDDIKKLGGEELEIPELEANGKPPFPGVWRVLMGKDIEEHQWLNDESLVLEVVGEVEIDLVEFSLVGFIIQNKISPDRGCGVMKRNPSARLEHRPVAQGDPPPDVLGDKIGLETEAEPLFRFRKRDLFRPFAGV